MSSSLCVCVHVWRERKWQVSPLQTALGPSSMAWYHLSSHPFLLPPSSSSYLLAPSWGPIGAGSLPCTGLLIGNRAAAHLLIESRLGPWGRAVNQAPHGIKSWRLTGHCKSRAANSGSVYPSVLELDLSVRVHVRVSPFLLVMCAHVHDVNARMVACVCI